MGIDIKALSTLVFGYYRQFAMNKNFKSCHSNCAILKYAYFYRFIDYNALKINNKMPPTGCFAVRPFVW